MPIASIRKLERTTSKRESIYRIVIENTRLHPIAINLTASEMAELEIDLADFRTINKSVKGGEQP